MRCSGGLAGILKEGKKERHERGSKGSVGGGEKRMKRKSAEGEMENEEKMPHQ